MKHTLCTKLDAQVIQANLNFWEALGGKIVTFDNATCMVADLPFPDSNKIFIKNSGILSQKKVDDLIGFFEEKNMAHIWLIPKSNKDAVIEKYLHVHGFSPATHMPSMIRDSNRIESKMSAIQVVNIRAFDELALVNSIWQKSFCISDEASIKHLELLQNCYKSSKDAVRFYLAYRNNAAVGTGWLFLDKECAGIYNIATLPEARKQGVAESVMQKLVVEALHFGYNTICLSALPEAQSIYKRLGFYTVGEYWMYKRKWPELESNQRHKDFQSSALPTELSGQKLYCKNFVKKDTSF